MNIKIMVAAHKKYRMPADDMYMPLHVGAEGKLNMAGETLNLGYQKDNTGDNISCKNANYCELTGLYWGWKNLDADYIGLVHYRRHFEGSGKMGQIFFSDDPAKNSAEFPESCQIAEGKWRHIISREETEKILEKTPVLLPRKRNYYIETNYSQYAHAHHAIDLDTAREIISEKYPGYVAAYDRLMSQTKEHRFNMFIMRRDLMDDYCSWLFDILEELEKRLDISSYSPNDSRVFGFVSERLLDVWIETNNIQYSEVPVINMESQNWLKKGSAFLKRKFLAKK